MCTNRFNTLSVVNILVIGYKSLIIKHTKPVIYLRAPAVCVREPDILGNLKVTVENRFSKIFIQHDSWLHH